MTTQTKIMIANLVGMAVLALGMWGIEVTEEQRGQIIAGLGAIGTVINMVLVAFRTQKTLAADEVQAVIERTNKQGGYARPQFLLSLGVAMLAGVVSLPGCASITQDATSKLAIQYATAKAIEQAEDPAAKAERIRNVAERTLGYVEGSESVSLTLIEAAVVARVCWECLSPADQMMARALIAAIQTELQARVGAGEIAGDQLVPVRTVLTWVIEATRYAVPNKAAS